MLTLTQIQAAAENLRNVIHYTPLDFSRTFSQLSGSEVYLKLENLQKTGSFKIRGASHKISQLSAEQKSKGVIAASAGNHAQGVAYASRAAGIPCTIVMPETAPLAKVEATSGYGAQIVLHGQNYDGAYARALLLQQETGATFIHAFDDLDIIAGQGTIGLEILQQLPDCEVLITPVGGGGLLAGVAAAMKLLSPGIHIVGVEAAGAACMTAAFSSGEVTALESATTIADGICVGKAGLNTFALSKLYADEILTVEDEMITKTMLLLLERSKLIVEGAGATGLAGLLNYSQAYKGKKVAVLLTGGNVDVHFLSRLIEHGLVEAGRYLRLATTISDRPGEMLRVLEILAKERANVISIQHYRQGSSLLLGQTEVELDLETRNQQHIQQILQHLSQAGYHFVIR